MTRPTIRVYTNANDYIDCKMNDAEYEQYKLDYEKAQADIEQEANKAVAKAALLDRLGITADEAKLLLGGN